MENTRVIATRWLAPLMVAAIGVLLSGMAFWIADRADRARVREALELRVEWRTRDLEAKILRSGSAVENIAFVMTANAPVDTARFNRIAARVREGVEHVQALQWVPRVLRAQLAGFEERARAAGARDYRVFDVNEDFQPTPLTDRPEYFPVLYDARPAGQRRPLGLALGRYDGRRIPMERARDSASPVATLPVRPIGPPSAELVFLLFWPVFETIEAPATPEERRAALRGYAVGNFNLTALLRAAVRDTPDIGATLHVAVRDETRGPAAEEAIAVYVPGQRSFLPAGMFNAVPRDDVATRIDRHFTAFGQHWDLSFDYSSAAVAELRTGTAWGWLLVGLLLTASLAFYLARERGRRTTVERLVAERTTELGRTYEQLHQAQKMEAIGALTGGIAHDFNNLLSVVIGNIDLLRDSLHEKELQGLADAALNSALRGGELTKQLLAFARRQPLEPKRVDVNALVGDTTRMLRRTLEQNIEVKLDLASDVWAVMIDPAQLTAAIANLATNARDAMPNGGRFTVATRNTTLDADYASLNPEVAPGEYVLLEISDSGVGMSRDVLGRVFEPFFTTKEVGKGTGLGLSMVFGFVKQSQGHVKIYSEPGQGTTVRLYLPRSAGDAVVLPTMAVETMRTGSETVLAVEDDADVRRIVVRQLTDLGYTVVEAGNAAEAQAHLAKGTRVDLLFTDVIMPGGMDGRDLARAAQAMRPGLRVLFTSGYPGGAMLNGGSPAIAAGELFLSKPYTKRDLAKKLREALDD